MVAVVALEAEVVILAAAVVARLLPVLFSIAQMAKPIREIVD
jgi:predicted aconitase with swiveling domain